MQKDLIDSALDAWKYLENKINKLGWTRELYVQAFLNCYLPKQIITISGSTNY